MKHASMGFAIAILVALFVGAAMAASQLPRARNATGADADCRHAVRGVHRLGEDRPWLVLRQAGRLHRRAVSLPAFAFAAADGMRGADPSSRELLASVDASRWEVLWHLRLPSALPSLFTAAKYNTGPALSSSPISPKKAPEDSGKIGSRAFAANEGDRLWAAIFSMAILGTISLVLLTAAAASGHGVACVTALATRLTGYGAR